MVVVVGVESGSVEWLRGWVMGWIDGDVVIDGDVDCRGVEWMFEERLTRLIDGSVVGGGCG